MRRRTLLQNAALLPLASPRLTAAAPSRRVRPGDLGSAGAAQWRQVYFGGHYPRLRAIKKQYDPEGRFCVHHGVHSEAWSADGFTRVAS